MSKICLIFLVVFAAASTLRACPVPVFYYALIEWPPDAHTLMLSKLTPETSSSLVSGYISRNSANIELEANDRPIKQGHVQVRFPRSNQVWWDGPLPDAQPEKGLSLLMDSPVRQALVRQLASGTSVVWLFLDSGDAKADEDAFKLLTDRIHYLQKITELPPKADGNNGELDNPDFTNAAVPLKIAFSILRVGRKDPREVGLVAQLLHLQPELPDVKGPMAFAVFGRARVVNPLYGQYLVKSNIDGITSFAVGSCSCQVKDMNLGTDLLVDADWNKIFDSERAARPPGETVARQSTNSEPEEVTIRPKNP